MAVTFNPSQVPLAPTIPAPLAQGTILGQFTVGQPLRHTGLEWIYETEHQGQPAWLWELAPTGFERQSDISVTHKRLDADEVRCLRGQVARGYASWPKSAGTATLRNLQNFETPESVVLITPNFDSAAFLEEIIVSGSRLAPEAAEQMLRRLLASVAHCHRHGLVHGLPSPRRILVSPDGLTFLGPPSGGLIWLADRLVARDDYFGTMHTPLEFHNSLFPISVQSDLYGVAATMTFWLSGRLGDDPRRMLEEIKSSLSPTIFLTLKDMLSPGMEARPTSVNEVISMLADKPAAPKRKSLRDLERMSQALQKLKYARRQCPVCGDVLESPEPLKKGRCPVCLTGVIRPIPLEVGACPQCHYGILNTLKATASNPDCPHCDTGIMVKTKRDKVFKCVVCNATEVKPQNVASREIKRCELCEECFSMPKNRRQTRLSDGQTRSLIEWAYEAKTGFWGSGNCECSSCSAKMLLKSDRMTITHPGSADERRFGIFYRNRALSQEHVRWAAVGQLSPLPGLVCVQNDCEFDGTSEKLKLVRAAHPVLAEYAGQTNTLGNWHRIALGLPLEGHEQELENELKAAILNAYLSGEIGFSSNDSDLIWHGRADMNAGEKVRAGLLRVSCDQITFKGVLYRQGAMMTSISSVETAGDLITLSFEESEIQWEFTPQPVVLTIKLNSGKRKIALEPSHLVKRLRSAAKKL